MLQCVQRIATRALRNRGSISSLGMPDGSAKGLDAAAATKGRRLRGHLLPAHQRRHGADSGRTDQGDRTGARRAAAVFILWPRRLFLAHRQVATRTARSLSLSCFISSIEPPFLAPTHAPSSKYMCGIFLAGSPLQPPTPQKKISKPAPARKNPTCHRPTQRGGGGGGTWVGLAVGEVACMSCRVHGGEEFIRRN